MIPAALDRVARTCPAKDPNERFQPAHDLRLQLQLCTRDSSRVATDY
jgi:hypothetical protein